MKITITIDTSNAAFEKYGAAAEISNILHYLSDTWRKTGVTNRKLRDINGNVVGEAIIKDENPVNQGQTQGQD